MNESKVRNRVVTLLLALILIVGIMPTTVFAENVDQSPNAEERLGTSAKGKVSVNHILEIPDNKTVIWKNQINEYAIETPYTTEPQIPSGYILKTTPANKNGTVAAQETIVNYVYAPDPTKAGETTIHILVDDKGTETLHSVDDPFSGANGASYKTVPRTVSGYYLVSTPTNANGTLKTGQHTYVFYRYRKSPTTPSRPGRYTSSSGSDKGTTRADADINNIPKPEKAAPTTDDKVISEPPLPMTPPNANFNPGTGR